MWTRRSFIKGAGAAGVVFCSCSMLDAARAQSPTGSRLPVTVKGQRVKTIDLHAHCVFREGIALMGADGRNVLRSDVKGTAEQVIVVEERLKAMDAMGIDMEILSINPFWYRKDRDTAAAIVRVQNEKLAELCASKPDRFGAFASLSLQFPDLAVKQLEDGMKKYGLAGAAIGGSVAGEEFADPKFHPVWAKAEELGAVLFIHPQSTPELAKRFKGNGWLANTIGNPLDTTIALQHLIFEGTLDRFPSLKICAAHGGGYLPSYAPRSDHACFVSPANCNPEIKLKKKPTEYLNQLYFDALVFTPEALRHLVAQVGASQIVLGTDHPIPWHQRPVDHIFATETLSDAEKVAILGGNAARLLGIKT
jgi:predicted TIM-barrel fold metal-dependent hydrolase